ncbi:hypothetical protein [Vibrio phage V-YDF132]|nr:hypothetical protein [Vibrio phage V-YDF132]
MTERKLKSIRQNDATEMLVRMRRFGMSTPRTMILSAVRDATETFGEVLIGEVHAMYHSGGKGKEKPYSYSGIASMLRSLEKEGLVTKARDGAYITYIISKAGRNLLSKLEM